MKYNFNKSSSDPTKSENNQEVRARELSVVRDVFENLLVTATASVGFPRDDLSDAAIQDGVTLTREFLKVSNPQARRLIIDLVEIIAELTADR